MHEQPASPDSGGPKGGRVAAQIAEPEPLKTIPIGLQHRADDFRCAQSKRVTEFFTREMPLYVPRGYCRVFVMPDPADATGLWGYYTLSPSEMRVETLTKSQQKKAIGHIPVPLVRVGFMGRDDQAPKGYGAALLVDAARRVYRSEAVTAWGLILDAEGGPANVKLFRWYRDTMGFTPIRDASNAETGTMYCPLRRLLPELQNL